MKNKDIFKDTKWIWIKEETEEINQYSCFRKSFTIEKIDSESKLYISADTDFIVYINGKETGRGQFPDYPGDKTYSEFSASSFLKEGNNTIAILAYYCGEDFSTYRKGEPGIIAVFKNGSESILSTDDKWKAVRNRAYVSGRVPKVTGQMGFTVEFDARKNDENWTLSSFDDSSWDNAIAKNRKITSVKPRPIKQLNYAERIDAEIVISGELRRTGEYETAAETSSKDMLLPLQNENKNIFEKFQIPDSNGYFAIGDLKETTVGMIDISIEATAGTIVDISHGEHLDDGRVRCFLGGRNFTDRYICKEGLNEFVFPFRRAGCRYIEVHFVNSSDRQIKINHMGIRPVSYPLPAKKTFFESNDHLANKTHAVSMRTLEMCMHDHYEDCPWREQALYAYDSRNQILYGYYLWGNYDFAKASIELLGKGLREDGILELCAPARVPVTIPIFSLVWISEIYEHGLHSGNSELFNEFFDTIKIIIDTVKKDRDQASGLYRLGQEKAFWHFYEWTEGLSGEKIPAGTTEIHCCYNIYLYEALVSYSKMLGAAGRKTDMPEIEKYAAELAKAINNSFWDNENNCYATKIVNGKKQGMHEHVQAIALYNDLADKEKVPLILEKFYSKEMIPISLSSMIYMLKAFMKLDPAARGFMSETISENFEKIVLTGASTLWETINGSKDFAGAGSLCHAWSSLPAYYYNSYVLGIEALEPGFKKFKVAPYPDRFYNVKGTVPTPSGDIEVEWQRLGENRIIWDARGPEGLEAELVPYAETEIISATYNARKLN